MVTEKKNKHINTRTMHPMQILLLPLGDHVHLAEPGRLCTKQALWAAQAKLLEQDTDTKDFSLDSERVEKS